MAERVFKRRIRGRDGVIRLSKVYYAWVPRVGGGTKRVSTLCADKQAALAVAAKLERSAVDPHHAAAQTARTVELLDQYIASRIRVGRTEGTLHHVRTKAGHLRRLLPEYACEITHPVCEAYVDARLAEPGNGPDGMMQRTTIKKELRILKATLKLAAKNKLFLEHPDNVIPELEDDYMPRERWLTPWELVALVSELEREPQGPKGGDPVNHAAVVAFIVATGARWSEAGRARPEHIDWTAMSVTLVQSKTKRITKRAKREVPLTGLSANILRWAVARAWPGGGLMFAPWSNVRRSLRWACKRAGIAPCSPNDLRRTFSKWLRHEGVETSLIASAMGHTSSRMVEKVYGRIPAAELGKLLRDRVGSAGLLMADAVVDSGPIEVTRDSDESDESSLKQAVLAVPRDRIELPTRGFSIRAESSGILAESEDLSKRWPANGQALPKAENSAAERDLVEWATALPPSDALSLLTLAARAALNYAASRGGRTIPARFETSAADVGAR